jgi:RNA polymerase subunit RPABC4/transcription elongation factor Spt4
MERSGGNDKAMEPMTCRYCKRPIAVPASKCPWCGEVIMVICANCKTYTDDQRELCMHCNKPLQPDHMDDIVLQAHHPELARMVEDRKHARLVASAVVLYGVEDFFHSSEGFQTVLAGLFGPAAERGNVEAGVVFAAYAYLCQEGYCSIRLQVREQGETLPVDHIKAWDGQESIEGELAEHIGRALTTAEATEKMLRRLMGFRMTTAESGALGAHKVLDIADRAAFAAVDQLARGTALPDWGLKESRRATYKLLTDFVAEDPQRARALATEIKRLLRDFESYT